jgi:probable HAF family extracellular repeat protein
MDEFTVEDPKRISQRREDAAAQCWAVARKCVLGLSLALACQTALAQAMYRIKPLGDLGGCGSTRPSVVSLSEAGQVAGTACNAHGDQHAFLWKNDGHPMVDLGPDEVGSTSTAHGMNSSGLVAGSATDSTGKFGFVSSGDGTAMTRINDTLGGSVAEAYAVNDSGQVTGYATLSNSWDTAFLWQNNGAPMLDLVTDRSNAYDVTYGQAINASGQVAGVEAYTGEPYAETFIWTNHGTPLVGSGFPLGISSEPCCINASGQIAGGYKTRGTVRAFYWVVGGTQKDLGSFAKGGGGSNAVAQNDAGQIAGWADTRWNGKPHAFVWMNDGTPKKDLGTLGGTNSQANDINSSGQATGFAYLAGDSVAHAFLWRNDGGEILDLNSLIDPLDPLKPFITLTSGAFINDHGDIAAAGTDSRSGDGVYLLQGTVLTLAPRSLGFGNQPINSTSAAKSVVMTNTSAQVVAITSIALKGAAVGQFASTNNCGSSLMGHAICTIKVTFKPTTKGAKTESLNVNGGGGGLRVVNLAGTGI